MPGARATPRDGTGINMSRSKALGAPSAPKVLGGKLPRIDGPLKVSGRATYTSDISLPGMLYAVPVRSTIASGRVVAIDDRVARKMLGVRAIYYRGNIRPFFRSGRPQGFSGLIGEERRSFEGGVVGYCGGDVGEGVGRVTGRRG